jgi:ElaB/YqjD/DUF883 family membrane-anchored ribosome-binding protein
MAIEIIITVIGAILSLLGAGIASTKLVNTIVYEFLGKVEPKKTFSERLAELTKSLTNASAEVDSILAEMSHVAKEKQSSVKKLEQSLSQLENQEKDLKDRIKELETVPIPVAEHFVKLMESGERRNRKRDYALFGAGVVVTTLITIIIQLLTG